MKAIDTLREAPAGVPVPQEAPTRGGEPVFSLAEEGWSKDRPVHGSAESVCATHETEGAAAGPQSDSGQELRRERRELGSRTPKTVRVALLVLDFYKVWLSPLLAGSCRYQPTCSRYAYEAIERFGLARGVWLGMKRLLRCHPFTKRFGYDPVPERWEEMASHSVEKQIEAGRPLPSSGQAEERAVHGGVRS